MNVSPTFEERAAVLHKLYGSKPLVRVLNFHNTSREHASHYDELLAKCSQCFSSVNEEELGEHFISGKWRKPKPGLIVASYEGYRNNYDVLAPLLERHDFVGWFFIVTGFVELPIGEQQSFAESHRIWMRKKDYGDDGRYAMSWDEVRELDRKHVVASHTRTHVRLATLDSAALASEILGPQEDLRKQLGHRVRSFASLTGVAFGEIPDVDRLISNADYDFVFSSFRIQRVRRSDCC